MFTSPGPIFLKVGPLTIRWYGLMIALGFLAAAFAAKRLAQRWGLEGDKIINGILLAFIGGILAQRQAKAVRRRRADERRAAHLHRPDRARRILAGAERDRLGDHAPGQGPQAERICLRGPHLDRREG